MKTNATKQWMKIAIAAVIGCFGVSTLQAQIVDSSTVQQKAITYKARTATDTVPIIGGSVKVIDNKGTVKYLQSLNGITTITNTDPKKGLTTTTWQLGGKLVDSTYINVSKRIFALDSLRLIRPGSTAASLSGTTYSVRDSSAHFVADGSNQAKDTLFGWTVLIRDERTGAINKVLAEDLVLSGQQKYKIVYTTIPTASVDSTSIVQVTDSATNLPYAIIKVTVPGQNNKHLLPSLSKISVYRNGIKLMANDDYTICRADGSLPAPGHDLNYLKIKAHPVPSVEGLDDDQQYQLLPSDKIEVHWFK